MFLTRKIFRRISSPKISSGKKSSNTPSRGNFRAQNFLETRKFYVDIFGSLDNRTEISTVFSAVLTHASSHTNVAPRGLTNVRGRTAVFAGMMIDFFCFQSGLVT